MSYPHNLQGSKLTYGSGTTIDAWVQTSIDGQLDRHRELSLDHHRR
jgi:hypothetical protein